VIAIVNAKLNQKEFASGSFDLLIKSLKYKHLELPLTGHIRVESYMGANLPYRVSINSCSSSTVSGQLHSNMHSVMMNLHRVNSDRSAGLKVTVFLPSQHLIEAQFRF
jgi:hypothetical protein